MPLLTSLIAAAALGQQASPPNETKIYSDPATGVEFNYPKEWRYRKERLFSKLEFSLSDGKKAEVQLLGSDFRQSPQQWQDIQVEINASVRRVIERQWEEIILGVPLLFTKLNYKEGDNDVSTLVGLLYSRTPKKLNFRLTAPAASFEEAESTWRGILNSLRTVDGQLPQVEEAGSSDVRTVPGGGTDGKTVVLKPEEIGATQSLRGLKKTTISALDTQLDLWLPKGWEVEEMEGGYKLANKGFNGSVNIQVLAGGLPQAQSTILQRMDASMNQFSTIRLRKEFEPKGTKAGCSMIRVERHGTEGDLPLVKVFAAGVRGTNHWLLSYEVKSLDHWKKDEGKLGDLLDGMVVQASAP